MLWFTEGWVAFGDGDHLFVVPPDGTAIQLPFPAMWPYDDDQREWPMESLYFVEMFGVLHVTIAMSMREACRSIESANGWSDR